jgi:hypothetical protein
MQRTSWVAVLAATTLVLAGCGNDGDGPIDASGVLPDGTSFEGALALGQILSEDPRFPRCLTKNFMTFAIGRILGDRNDNAWIEHLTDRARATDGSLKSIIRTVVLSEAFRSRSSATEGE